MTRSEPLPNQTPEAPMTFDLSPDETLSTIAAYSLPLVGDGLPTPEQIASERWHGQALCGGRFAHLRAHGEWFHAGPSLLDHIRSLSTRVSA